MINSDYNILRLRISQNQEEVLSSVSQQAWGRLALKKVQDLLNAAQSLDSKFDANSHLDLGQALFNGLIAGQAYQDALANAQRQERRLILLIETTEAALHSLPWEALHDGQNYLCLSDNVQILRLQAGTKPLEAKVPIRLLLSTQDDLEEERQLTDFKYRAAGVVELVSLRQCTAMRVIDELQSAERRGKPYHIWHHYGKARLVNQSIELSFKDSNLNFARLSKLLGQLPELRVLCLNIRYSQSQASLVRQELAALPVPLLLSFANNPDDFAAAQIFPLFYEKFLLEGLYPALSAIRSEMSKRDMGTQDWASLTVQMRSPDAEILRSPEPEELKGYSMRDSIFISYSHNDSKWLELLQVHLKPLERDGLVSFWSDKKLEIGDDWLKSIREAVSNAKIAVLLVSPHFLASDFIAEEELSKILDAAEKDGLQIFWIPVSDSVYTLTPIARYQAAHNPQFPLDTLTSGEVNQILAKIAKKLAQVINK
jgi:hypothetical protein